MILKQLLGLLVTILLTMFVGSFAWYMLGPVFPALVYFDFVRLAAVGMLVVVSGRLLGDLKQRLDQSQGRQVTITKIEGNQENAQLAPRPSE